MPYTRRRRGDPQSSLLHRYSDQLGRSIERGRAELALAQGAKLKRVDALMRNVVENSFDGILTIRDDGGVEMANDAAVRLFGYKGEELLRAHVRDLFPETAPDCGDLGTLFQLGHGHRETTGRKSNGTVFPLELALSDMHMGEHRLFIAIIRDITERKAQQQQLEHQALHDALTGLPNRVLLMDRLTHALDLAQRQSEPLGLLLLDLDRFKEINDTLGHHVGDLLLRDVAKRLIEPLRRTDTIARLGGDEFAVLLPAVTDLERAERVSRRLEHVLERPFQVETLSLEVAVSIGIALYPDHAEDGSKLLQCADVAMYTAKTERTGIELYDAQKDHNTVRHLTLSGELRQAIETEQLSFHYQPKLDLATRRVTQVEALARWHHPKHGFIPPEEFVIQAERTGLIQPLILWEFNTALGQLAAWKQTGLEIGMAINLSAGNLHHETLPEILGELLEKWAVEPEKLTLEITESAIMIDPESALEVLKRLDQIGLRLSIDDFGTGYSSLAGLKRLPVDELKIDKSFVMEMNENESDLIIVRSTIDLAHNLGLKVVAEGVESEQHIAVLSGLGCDLGQGFYISKPMPVEEITEWFRHSDYGAKNGGSAAEGSTRPADTSERESASG
ncbi:MAG: EAL domain-containing protein [Kiloniellales bacterium]|nr:EAL domain-containing protein [Kiloniellales bacterium]